MSRPALAGRGWKVVERTGSGERVYEIVMLPVFAGMLDELRDLLAYALDATVERGLVPAVYSAYCCDLKCSTELGNAYIVLEVRRDRTSLSVHGSITAEEYRWFLELARAAQETGCAPAVRACRNLSVWIKLPFVSLADRIRGTSRASRLPLLWALKLTMFCDASTARKLGWSIAEIVAGILLSRCSLACSGTPRTEERPEK
jgi:hypothetical protein